MLWLYDIFVLLVYSRFGDMLKAEVRRSFTSEKTTPCQIPTYTGISRDNSTWDLSQDIPV